MRPIDADELKRGIEALCKDERASISAATYFALMAFINKMPTIEAETVKHAKWEICSDGYYPYCSNCKNEPQSGEMTLLCPNCGAKMDGDET